MRHAFKTLRLPHGKLLRTRITAPQWNRPFGVLISLHITALPFTPLLKKLLSRSAPSIKKKSPKKNAGDQINDAPLNHNVIRKKPTCQYADELFYGGQIDRAVAEGLLQRTGLRKNGLLRHFMMKYVGRPAAHRAAQGGPGNKLQEESLWFCECSDGFFGGNFTSPGPGKERPGGLGL